MNATKRKRRSDRKHLIYVLTNTVTGDRYVGMTVCMDRSGKKSLEARWTRHVGRAFNQDLSWKLCENIRAHGPDVFKRQIVCFVRGKAAAHQLETEIKNTGKYALNTV
jgi:hypothetical protein